jgi:midasin
MAETKEKVKVVVKETEIKDKSLPEQKREEMKLIGLEKEKRAIQLGIRNSFPVLLIGETGVGKTYSLFHIAKEMDKRIVRLSLNGEVGINELLGKFLIRDGATYWQDGVLVEAMRKGWWIILDEINAALPEVLFCINSLLDDSRSIVLAEKDGEKVNPHKDFRIFATMNPCDEYAGTKEMNKALLSRFPIVLYYSNYQPDTELEIVKYQSGIEDNIARVMIDVANVLRQLKDEKEIYHTVSTRDVVNWARVLGCNGHTIAEAFEFSILNKASMEEREKIVRAAIKASKVKIDWKWEKEKFRSLTSDLAIDIEKLKEKKAKLVSAIEIMEGNLQKMKQEVDE